MFSEYQSDFFFLTLQVYLLKLVNDPKLLQRRKGVRNDKTQKLILGTARDGLKYLNSRKKFWQQQNPLYSRENEIEYQSLSLHHL